MINIKCFSFNPFQENSYLVWDSSGQGLIIDPGCYDEVEIDEIREDIALKNISPVAILLTHGHFDHIFGVEKLSGIYKIPIYMNEEDKIIVAQNPLFAQTFGLKTPSANFYTLPVREGDILNFGEIEFTVIATPGHTPGGVCYYDKNNKVLFTGDTLFAGSIGRTDFQGGDYDKLIVGIMDKLMGLDGDVDILPGHGPSSNIGYERVHNPFLQPFNEPNDVYEGEEGDIIKT